MARKITANTNVSLTGQIFMLVFCVAGVAIVLYGLAKLVAGHENATGEFVLSVLLGGGFLGGGLLVLRSQMRQRNRIRWLDRHGTWIRAQPTEVRTVTTDSVGRCESYLLVLDPVDEDRKRFGLDGVRFESEQIWARSVPENYKDLTFDVVIDRNAPMSTYFVNVDLSTLSAPSPK
jgi:hypothetical protein